MSSGRVLLVSANSETLPSPVYPLALAHLAGALGQKGYSVRQYDLQAHGPAALKTMIKDAKPDLVGISIRNIDNIDSGPGRFYLDEYREIVDSIRACTKAPIVAGGSGFSLFPREAIASVGADYGIVGAGEQAVCELMEVVKSQRAASSVRGLVAAGGDGPVGTGKVIASPHVAHDPEIVDFYWRHGGMIGVRTKHGCPGECSYCTYPLIEGRTVVLDDPAQVVGQMERLVKDHGVDYFFIVDSVFNLSREHDEALVRELVRRGLKIRWGAFFTPKGIDREYLRMLKGSGLEHVELGSDSMSERMLESYRKGFTVGDIVRASEACGEENVYCAHYVIFGGPGETQDTVRETIANAERLERCIIFPFAGARVYPGTRLYEEAVRDAVVSREDNCLRPTFYFARGLSRESIWQMVEGAPGAGKWALSARLAEQEPMMRRFRERGIKGPMWEYLMA